MKLAWCRFPSRYCNNVPRFHSVGRSCQPRTIRSVGEAIYNGIGYWAGLEMRKSLSSKLWLAQDEWSGTSFCSGESILSKCVVIWNHSICHWIQKRWWVNKLSSGDSTKPSNSNAWSMRLRYGWPYHISQNPNLMPYCSVVFTHQVRRGICWSQFSI